MAAGVALSLAHPPVALPFLAVLVPILFLTALRLAPSQAGRLGFLAGFVGHGAMLSWIIAPAGVVGWVLLAAIQGGWWALLAVVLVRWLDRPWILAVAPFAWVGIDLWKVTVPLGGFLWGDLASATVDITWLHPAIRLGGAHMATLAVVAIGSSVWFVADRLVDAVAATEDAEAAMPLATSTTQVGLFTLVGVVLAVTLATVAPPLTDGVVDVLIVQGNDVEDWLGTSGDLDVAIAERMVGETHRALDDATSLPDITLWPESSIDRDPSRDSAIMAAVVDAANLTGGNLLAGVNLDGDEPRTYRNSLVHFGIDGEFVDSYVKRNLVPFGEYVPYRDALDWFPPLQQVPRDGIPGDGPDVVRMGGIELAPVICFETMEPRTVRSNVLAGDAPAGVIVVSTNDASFGRTGEPAQHLAQARLRAIENGRWVVYGAVSGRSAFIDQEGVVTEQTDLFTRDHLRRDVPVAIGRTPYLVVGDVIGPIAATVLFVLVVWGLWQRRRDREQRT